MKMAGREATRFRADVLKPPGKAELRMDKMRCDVAGGVMSAYTLLTATRVGAPPSVLIRMAANILADTIVGAVPLLGDLFDAGFKARRVPSLVVELKKCLEIAVVHRSSIRTARQR